MARQSQDLSARHQKFAELHQSGCFVMPNPWDLGSAKVMAAHGAKALGSTSAGFAYTLGRPDMGTVSLEEALTHAESLVRGTNLPISGDLENGFADSPDDVARTIRLASEVGLSGCSIEDTRMVKGNPSYGFDDALERIAACVDAKNSLSHPFVLCARADGVMNGVYDIEEAIKRIKEFEKAGADLLYVPLVTAEEDIRRLIQSVTIPINVLVTGSKNQCSRATLARIGVRRISLGSAAARVTHQATIDVCKGIFDHDDFTVLDNKARGNLVDDMLD